MSKGVGILLGTIVLGAVVSVVLLLVDGPMGSSGRWLGGGTEESAEEAALLEAEAASLAARENARRPKTPEELAAERAAAEAPTFAKGEGVFGTVTDGRGAPIANAVVKLLEGDAPKRQQWGPYGQWGRPDAPQIAQATTNAQGEFLVGPAPEDAFLRIRADAEGYAATVRDLKRRGYRVDLVLDVGGSLVVETKDTEGVPISGARVFHQAGIVLTEASTDADGRVTLTNLPTGRGQLLASSPQHAAVMQGDVGVSPDRTETVTLVLGAPIVVEGTVTEADGIAPLEGVQVALDYYNMPWLKPAEPVRTDEAGAFEIEALAGLGQWISLEAEAPDHAPHKQWLQLQDAGEGRMKVEVKLSEERAPVRGRVVDANGHAAGGALVTYGSRGVPNEELPETTASGDGSFELPPPPWATGQSQSVQIVASAPGKGVGAGRAQVVKPGETSDPAVVTLCGVGRVEGKVVDGGGTPLAGALVTLLLDWQAMREEMGGNYNSSVFGAISNSSVTRLDGVSDLDGKFVLEEVPCAAYRIQAEYGLDRITLEEPVVVRLGETSNRQVEFVEGSTIEGYVYDSEDRPVAGATVSGSPSEGGRRNRWAPGGAVSGRTQNDGRFVLHGASQGAYDIQAYAAGYESATEKDVASGTTDVTLRLKAMGWVEGVVELNGLGYRGTFTVRAVGVGDRRSGRMNMPQFNNWMPGSRQSTFSPDDGRFELRGLKSGEYDLTVTSPEGHIGAEAVRVAVVDGTGTRARLALVAGATITGQLVSDASGLPVPKARISVNPQASSGQVLPGGSAQTDAEGRFVVRGLGTGAYVIHVWPPDGVNFQQTIDLVAGEEATVELRQETPGAIQIRIVDEDGAPIAGVRPTVTAPGGGQIWPNWNALQREGIQFGPNTWQELLQTNEHGLNLRRHVPPGTYTIQATMNGYRPSNAVPVTVRSDRTAEVQVVLSRMQTPGN